MRILDTEFEPEILLKAGIFIELILPVLHVDYHWLAGFSCMCILIGSVGNRRRETGDDHLRLMAIFYCLLVLHSCSIGATTLFSEPQTRYLGLIFFVDSYKIYLLAFAFSLLYGLTASTAAIGRVLELAFWTVLAILCFQLLGDISEPISRQISSAGMMFFTVPNDSTYLVLLGAASIALSRQLQHHMLLIPVVCIMTAVYFESRLSLLQSALLCLAVMHRVSSASGIREYGILFAALVTPALLLIVGSDLGHKVANTTLWNERLALWWTGIASWPGMIGHGVGSFLEAYEEAKASSLIPIFLPLELRPVHWAHNIFIEAFYERGVIGLATTLILITLLTAKILVRCVTISNWDHMWPLAMFLIFCTLEASLYNSPALLLLALFIFMATLPSKDYSATDSQMRDHHLGVTG